MPSSDQPQEIYNSYVEAVDQVICQVSSSSPLIMAGDLNCHLGHLGGPKSSHCFNSRGLQWKELIDRHSLYVTSFSNIATGPIHTYYSNRIVTTLDYMIDTSDHLPIVSKLNVDLPLSMSPKSQPTLDWNRASNDGSVSSYESLSNDLVKPLLAKDYSSIHEIEADICHVSKSLISIAYLTVTNSRPPNQGIHRIKDAHLSTLCWRSREAFRQWKAVGCPRAGPAYEKRCKRDVSSHLAKCRARAQRISIQNRDDAFRSRHPKRFKSYSQKTGGSSLIMNDCVVTDPQHVLHHWVDHFTTLGKSRCPTNSLFQETQSRIPVIKAQSYTDSELLLDLPFLPEEVEAAIKHLKRSSSGGPDSITPHHLLHTGSIFKDWLCHIFNKIVELESIPASFKAGTITPIYKGKGKDPLSPSSYRGITLTSAIAKCLCFSIDCYPYSVIIMYLNSLRLPIKRGSTVLKPFLPVRKSFQNLSGKVTLFIPMTSLLHLILSNIPFFSTIYGSLVLLGRLGVL